MPWLVCGMISISKSLLACNQRIDEAHRFRWMHVVVHLAMDQEELAFQFGGRRTLS